MKHEAKTFDSKLTSKGQLTLPLEIREALNVAPGDHVEFALHRTGEVFVHGRTRPATAIVGKGAAYARKARKGDPERLVGEAVAARGAPADRKRSRRTTR